MDDNFPKLVNEFYHENYLWPDWTNLTTLKYIEDEIVFHQDDILLVSYLKCGNTLISEMLWLLKEALMSKDINKTFEKALSEKIFTRVPFLEVTNLFFEFEGFQKDIIPLEYLKGSRNKGEIIKTHLPWCILKKAYIRHQNRGLKFPKILFVTRNPKDTLVSLDNFYRLCEELGPYDKSFNSFYDMWISGHIVNGDYRQHHLDWFNGFKELSDEAYHIFYYEDCVLNPLEVLVEIKSSFFREESLDNIDELYRKICEHTKFSQMRNNKMVNYEDVDLMVKGVSFMRKGVVKDWPNHFSKEQNAIFDKTYEDFFKSIAAMGFSNYVNKIKKYI